MNASNEASIKYSSGAVPLFSQLHLIHFDCEPRTCSLPPGTRDCRVRTAAYSLLVRRRLRLAQCIRQAQNLVYEFRITNGIAGNTVCRNSRRLGKLCPTKKNGHVPPLVTGNALLLRSCAPGDVYIHFISVSACGTLKVLIYASAVHIGGRQEPNRDLRCTSELP